MTNPSTLHSGATRWSVLFLALFAGIFGAFQNGKMPAALPTLTAELGLTLVEAGYTDIEEVRTAEEDLMFSLPKELRQDNSGKRDERALGGRVSRT